MSVKVVKKMLLAVAGSAPNRLSTNGTATPKMPLPMQAPTMAIKITRPSMAGLAESVDKA